MKSILFAVLAFVFFAPAALAQWNPNSYQQWQQQGASPGEAFSRSFQGPPPPDYRSVGPGNLPYTGYPSVSPAYPNPPDPNQAGQSSYDYHR